MATIICAYWVYFYVQNSTASSPDYGSLPTDDSGIELTAVEHEVVEDTKERIHVFPATDNKLME